MLWTEEYDYLKSVHSKSKGAEEKPKHKIFLIKKIKRVMKPQAKDYGWLWWYGNFDEGEYLETLLND